jgi:hypothetical protein
MKWGGGVRSEWLQVERGFEGTRLGPRDQSPNKQQWKGLLTKHGHWWRAGSRMRGLNGGIQVSS